MPPCANFLADFARTPFFSYCLDTKIWEGEGVLRNMSIINLLQARATCVRPCQCVSDTYHAREAQRIGKFCRQNWVPCTVHLFSYFGRGALNHGWAMRVGDCVGEEFVACGQLAGKIGHWEQWRCSPSCHSTFQRSWPVHASVVWLEFTCWWSLSPQRLLERSAQ